MFSFDPDAVKNLNWLTQKADARLVISSTWRLNRTLGQLRDIFTAEGVSAQIIGSTVDLRDSTEFQRGTEIDWWLKSSRHHIDSFVIIDDDSFDIAPLFPDKLVKTNVERGLTMEDAKLALDILESNHDGSEKPTS